MLSELIHVGEMLLEKIEQVGLCLLTVNIKSSACLAKPVVTAQLSPTVFHRNTPFPTAVLKIILLLLSSQ